MVDQVIATVAESGVESRSLTQALALPKEHEMLSKGVSWSFTGSKKSRLITARSDKYTVYSPKSKGYRKGIHKVPKFTRVSAGR